MTHKLKARLEWVKLYAETKNAGLVCRRCDISRPTLRKWWRRFQKSGQDGLEDLSRRPKSSQNRKIFEKEIKLVSELRKRRLGSLRIQSELLRNWCLFSNGTENNGFFHFLKHSKMEAFFTQSSATEDGIHIGIKYTTEKAIYFLDK